MKFALALSLVLCAAWPVTAHAEEPDAVEEAGALMSAENYPGAVALLLSRGRACDAGQGASQACMDIWSYLAVITESWDPATSELASRRELAIAGALHGPNAFRVRVATLRLADSLKQAGRYAEAEPLYRRAWDMAKALGLREEDDALVGNVPDLAEVIMRQGRAAEAEPWYRLALDIAERAERFEREQGWTDRSDDGEGTYIAFAARALAVNLDTIGKYDEAEALYRRDLKISGRYPPDTEPSLINGRWFLSSLLAWRGAKLEEARTLNRRAAGGIVQRMALSAGFDDNALIELRGYRAVFIGEVNIAWKLTGKKPG